MEHIKGKWESHKKAGGVFITISDGTPVFVAEALGATRAIRNSRANRICQGVNAFEEGGLVEKLVGAIKCAKDLYDELALSSLEAAAKYGDTYEPPTDKDWLDMREQLEQAIAEAKEGLK